MATQRIGFFAKEQCTVEIHFQGMFVNMRLVTLSFSHEIAYVQQDLNLADSLILHSVIVCSQVLTLEKQNYV